MLTTVTLREIERVFEILDARKADQGDGVQVAEIPSFSMGAWSMRLGGACIIPAGP